MLQTEGYKLKLHRVAKKVEEIVKMPLWNKYDKERRVFRNCWTFQKVHSSASDKALGPWPWLNINAVRRSRRGAGRQGSQKWRLS